MVFKRRNPRTWLRFIADGFWPKGGWRRAFGYIAHRLRRLPDPPHRIARGVAAGVFVCFTPFFGFHFILAAIVAFAIQGNILAALLATFIGNPLTFPLIAALSLELGNWMLGIESGAPLPQVFNGFASAALQLWQNAMAVFGPEQAQWDRLAGFFWGVFWPYTAGGFFPGLATATAAYSLAVPVVTAYKKRRLKKARERYEKRLKKLKSSGKVANSD